MAPKRRAIPLFLALALCFSCLFSCAEKGVLSYGSQSLSSDLFTYALTLNKTKTLATLLGSSQNLEDDPAIWTTDLGDGTTYADTVLDNTLSTMKMTLFYCTYAEEQGITLSAEEEQSVKESVEEIVSSFSSRKAFDEYMQTYGFDYDLIYRYYELDTLSQAGMRAYFQHPLTSLTEADVKAYYTEHYVTLLYLYVNETDMTLSNGKTVPLSEEQKAERSTYFEDAKAAVDAGGALGDWLEKSDDSTFSDKEKKTLLKSNVTPSALSAFVEEMDEGQTVVFSGEKGRYLVQKFETDEDFFEEYYEALLLSVISEREAVLLEEKKDDFVLNSSYFDHVNVADLAIF